MDEFLADAGVVHPAAHGEVVARDDDRTTVDFAAPGHQIGGEKIRELARLVVFRLAGKRPHLVEGAGIEQPVDPLADVELALVVMAGELLGAAHLSGQRLAPAKLIDLRFPAHRFRFSLPTPSAPQSPYLAQSARVSAAASRPSASGPRSGAAASMPRRRCRNPFRSSISFSLTFSP